MDWKRKKVLVTGAGGFIGSHLVEHLLEKGAAPRVLVRYVSRGSRGWLDSLPESARNTIEFAAGDIRDADIVRDAVRGIDIIFHLSALIAIPYSYRTPQAYFATNLTGTLNLLQAAREHAVEKFLHTSSSEVYGSAQYVPMDEKHPLRPQSPYAASKASADAAALSFHLSYDLPVTIVRPFNAFGPRQTPRAFVPAVILQCLKNRETGKAIKLGNLETRRDLTFVMDTVRGFVSVAEADKTAGETIHVGMGKDYSGREVLDLVLKRLGVDLPVEHDKQRFRPEKSEVQRLCCDNTKIKHLCGWAPQHSLEQGLEQTIAWFQEHLDLFDASGYAI